MEIAGDSMQLARALLLTWSDKSRLALAQYQKYHPDVTVGSFRSLSPVPLNLTNQKYQQQFERLNPCPPH